MSEPVILHATFTARAGEEHHVARLISQYARVVQQEPGNLIFEANQVRDTPERFFVYEAYLDEAAFREHLHDPAGQAFNAELTPLIVEPSSELTFLRRVP